MQKVEVTGALNRQGYIQFDRPLTISDRKELNLWQQSFDTLRYDVANESGLQFLA